MYKANAYNPYADALMGASQNKALMSGLANKYDQFMYPSGNPLQTGAYADPGYWT